MFKVGDVLVCRKDVCKIVAIKEKAFNNLDYYVLIPISDESLKIEVPRNSTNIRSLITRDQVEEMIKKIPQIKKIETADLRNNLIEKKYREFLNSGNHEDLISIIKATYQNIQARLGSNKEIGDKEAGFFKLAEQYLYNEFSVVLGMSYEDTKRYVMDSIARLDE